MRKQLAKALRDGTYTGSWTKEQAGGVRQTIRAKYPGLDNRHIRKHLLRSALRG